MTTQASLADHLESIPWEHLPQLYKNVMMITRRLGFEYIWIDSLCIIQDSRSDWLSESQRMGDAYQHARLTIATSHNANSNQSCFFPRAPPTTVVALPQQTAAGDNEGNIYATLTSKDYNSISPESGILATRAWATQEWLLSRRMIFYTEGSLVWSCRTISQRETGASFHSTARNVRWKNLVEKYSARQLTNSSDRLIALEGIRSELAKKLVNDEYCLGLWKNSMPDQLLWCCLQKAERAESKLDLPSWTWASTLHGIRFLDMFGAKNMCERIRFDAANRTLSMRCRMKKIERIVPWDHGEAAKSLLFATGPQPPKSPDTNLGFVLHDNTGLVGWSVLDEGAVPDGCVYCLRLMGSVTKGSVMGGGKRWYREWTLLLKYADMDEDVFERVGVGAIITWEAPWFDGCEVREVRLK